MPKFNAQSLIAQVTREDVPGFRLFVDFEALEALTHDERVAMVYIAPGNSKLGDRLPNISFTPGNDLIYLAITQRFASNVVGTCGKYCSACFNGGCYAVNECRAFSNTDKRYAMNAAILEVDPDAIRDAMINFCAKWYNNPRARKERKPFFRLNESGELTERLLSVYVDVCEAVPYVRFYGYTKATEILHNHRDELPANIHFVASQWNGSVSNPDNLAQFHYNDGSDTTGYTQSLTPCPAVDENGNSTGITCQECLWCAVANHGARMVYAH